MLSSAKAKHEPDAECRSKEDSEYMYANYYDYTRNFCYNKVWELGIQISD